MKYILISILLLLIGYGVTKTETKEATTVDSILIKSEQTFAKAYTGEQFNLFSKD